MSMGYMAFMLIHCFLLKPPPHWRKFMINGTIPIITTFHTSMYFKQWMQLLNTKKSNSNDILRLHVFYKIWKHLINYPSLHRINKQIMSKSAYGNRTF